MTTEALEARVARVEGIVGQMDGRLSSIETRINQLDQKVDHKIDALSTHFDGRFKELEDKRSQVSRDAAANFRWLVALILPMWASLILAIVLKS